MIANLFPNTASTNFIRVMDYAREFFTDILFLFPPVDSLFQRTHYLSHFLYHSPKGHITVSGIFWGKKWFFFFQIWKKTIFTAVSEKVKSVPAALMISTGCFCAILCGELVRRPTCFSSCHCRAWQNPGKLYLWEKQLGVKAVLLIRFSLVHHLCW